MSGASDDVSVLTHITNSSTVTVDPLYKVVSASTYVSPTVPYKLTAPDGSQFDFYGINDQYSEYDDLSNVYDNITSTLTPVGVESGHLDQLPQTAPHGSSSDTYAYLYTSLDEGGASDGGPSSGDVTTLVPHDADPHALSGIAVPDGTDLYVDGGTVYDFVNGLPQGVAQVVTDRDGTQTLVGAGMADPTQLLSVQLDYDLGGLASDPISSVPFVENDTGRPVLDAIATWWNDGGGADYSNDDITALLGAEAGLHPVQQQLLQQISVFDDGPMTVAFSGDSQTQADIDLFYGVSLPLVKDLIGGEIDGSTDTATQRAQAGALNSAVHDFEVTLLTDDHQAFVDASRALVSDLDTTPQQQMLAGLVDVAGGVLEYSDAHEAFGTVASYATGIVSAVNIAASVNQVLTDDTETQNVGVNNLISGTGSLVSSIGFAGAGAAGEVASQVGEIGLAYDGDDKVKLATAIAKAVTVLGFTAAGALEGGPKGADAGATFGHSVAAFAEKIGESSANSFGSFLDDHPDLLIAYNNGGYAGLERVAGNQVTSSLTSDQRGALVSYTDSAGLSVGASLVYGVSYAAHALVGF